MKFIYFSRQFNRSGFHILSHLLSEGRHIPDAILLPDINSNDALDDPYRAKGEIEKYRAAADYYGCQPLRFHESIHRLAIEHNIPVERRSTLRDSFGYEWLQSLSPDLMVLGGGWPELLPTPVIRLPRIGVINAHPSLLPAFRGTDVHRWQVFHGVRQSGTTIHFLDESFDTGDILAQTKVEIASDDPPQVLAEKAAIAAAPIMSLVLDRIASAAPERVTGIRQEGRNDASNYCRRWRWADRQFLRIDWSRTADEIHRFVLACTQELYSYNGPFFYANGQEYIIRQASLAEHHGAGQPGRVVEHDGLGIVVECGGPDSALCLIKVQPAPEKEWSPPNHQEPAIPARKLSELGNFRIGKYLL